MPGPLHTPWGAEALWQQLVPVLPGLSVEVLEAVESTNTTLIERSRSSGGRRQADTHPALLVAEVQTRGRGRMGRDWQSQRGASLTFSLALPMQPSSWAGLSLAVGLSLAEALEPQSAAAPRLLLKWPNDLYLADATVPGGGRKLGGILIETLALGERRLVVVGIGLNIQPLGHGFASLQELQPGITAPQALHRLALPLVTMLRRFEAEGFAPQVAPYAARDLLRGQRITTTLAQVSEGVAEGVGDNGALQVRAGAVLHEVSSGEVSVRPLGVA